MSLTFKLRNGCNVPVEVEGVTPDALAELSVAEIEKFPIYIGNRQSPLAEVFEVAGDPSNMVHRWEGDLAGIHWIGAKMASGHIIIDGDAGRHVGSEMQSGKIVVEGNVGDWAGAEMKGGELTIHGNAGHLVGAAYRGSRRGMTGGCVLIHGRVGNEIGHTMRRGLLAVAGDAGDLIGFNMLAGTILIGGDTGIRHGAAMRRGTIALLGSETVSMLPTFAYACTFEPTVWPVLRRRLRRLRFPLENIHESERLSLYNGDLISGGRGEIWTVPS